MPGVDNYAHLGGFCRRLRHVGVFQPSHARARRSHDPGRPLSGRHPARDCRIGDPRTSGADARPLSRAQVVWPSYSVLHFGVASFTVNSSQSTGSFDVDACALVNCELSTVDHQNENRNNMIVDMLRNSACRSVLALLTALAFVVARNADGHAERRAPCAAVPSSSPQLHQPRQGDRFLRVRQFPSTSRASWAGLPALRSPEQCPVGLHNGSHTTGDRASNRDLAFRLARRRTCARMEEFKRRKDVGLLPPLYDR